jgi:hypothetical protein
VILVDFSDGAVDLLMGSAISLSDFVSGERVYLKARVRLARLEGGGDDYSEARILLVRGRRFLCCTR